LDQTKINRKYGRYFEDGQAYAFIVRTFNDENLKWEEKLIKVQHACHLQSLDTPRRWYTAVRKIDSLSK
jgi:hypothetical protein